MKGILNITSSTPSQVVATTAPTNQKIRGMPTTIQKGNAKKENTVAVGRFVASATTPKRTVHSVQSTTMLAARYSSPNRLFFSTNHQDVKKPVPNGAPQRSKIKCPRCA